MSDNKQIAKNASLLYIRTVITTLIGIYTSRVILQALGIIDYGLYSVIGSIIGFISFINASMSGATSRFIAYELGRGDEIRLHKTFNATMQVHIGIAFVIVLLSESIGLWYLNNKLNIPENRMFAAQWVYQFSILSTIIGITQVPYTACMIAHERFNVFAYLDMFNAFAKLGILYLVIISPYDKLIFYIILMFMISCISCIYARHYCIRHFNEAHFKFLFDKQCMKEIVSFSYYNILGNMGVTINTHGTNLIINHFYGVALNASTGIATTCSGCINSFSHNIMSVMRPVITKNYAKNNIEGFQYYLIWAIKAILIAYALLAVPFYFSINEILDIWLINPPPYTNVLCQVLLISIYFETLRYIITIGIHATGMVMIVSRYNCILFLFNILIVYFILSLKVSPALIYVSLIFINLILSMIDITLLNRYVKELKTSQLYIAIGQVTSAILITGYLTYLFRSELSDNPLIRIGCIFIFSMILLCLAAYLLCLNKQQRTQLKSFLKNTYISKWKKS